MDGVTEVTQAQWQAVMGTDPSHVTQAGPSAPVAMVTWDDVQAFVGTLNAREAETRRGAAASGRRKRPARTGR
jgi:formylglycine-generating enzyme required for sulfatase activity